MSYKAILVKNKKKSAFLNLSKLLQSRKKKRNNFLHEINYLLIIKALLCDLEEKKKKTSIRYQHKILKKWIRLHHTPRIIILIL